MYQIQPLKVGECHTEPGPKLFFMREWGQTYSTAFYLWYIEGAGTRVLMDTGFDLPEVLGIMPSLVQRPDWRVAERFKQIGVDPRSIEHIIISHLHFDHLSSAVDLFPNAKLYLQKKEYETAVHPPHPWLAGQYLPHIVRRLDGDLRRRLEIIDGEAEILPNLKIFWVGGHTPGLQSVLLPTSLSPRTCLTSDQCLLYRNMEENIPVGICADLVEVCQAMNLYHQIADVIIPNHDPLIEQRFPLPAEFAAAREPEYAAVCDM